jgi:hypothetical protein
MTDSMAQICCGDGGGDGVGINEVNDGLLQTTEEQHYAGLYHTIAIHLRAF